MLVVTAYTGAGFFKAVNEQLKPRRLLVVVDEGTDPEAIEQIRNAVGSRLRKGGLALGRGSGGRLMHAKLYILTWKATGRRTLRYLVVGSPNASASAWSVHGNIESRLHLRLKKNAHSRVLTWMQEVGEAIRDVEHQGVKRRDLSPLHLVGDQVRMQVPGFELVPAGVPDFDSWLQQGVLCHEYLGDPSFIQMRVKLVQPLPVAASVERLAELGVVDSNGGKYLVYPYLKPELGPKVKDPRGEAIWRWRSRYFLESTLGWWTSRRCYRQNHDGFKAAGFAERRREVHFAGRGERHDDRVAAFLELMSEVSERLPTDQVGDWLTVTDTGALNTEFYEALAERQVRRDLVKARDSAWVRRYVGKFDFVPVPRFRADSESWERFAESIAETLWFLLHRERHGNIYAQALRDELELPEIPDLELLLADASAGRDPQAGNESILDQLRRLWPEVRDDVERALETALDTDG